MRPEETGEPRLSRRERRRGSERGQALVELALVAPVIVILIMAIAQFGYVIETQLGLTNAVREAARRAAADPNPTVASVQASLQGSTGLLQRNVQSFDTARVTNGSPTATDPRVEFCKYTLSGVDSYRVTVTVTYLHPVFFPMLSFATDAIDGNPDGNYTMTVSAQMRPETTPATPPTTVCT
jgi:Flp pilus assembly protein TadG